MKSSILALLVSLVACVYAAAISLEQDMQDLEKRVEDGDIISTTLEDGRSKIEIFENGVLEVSIIETANGGGASFLSPSPSPFSLHPSLSLSPFFFSFFFFWVTS